jgi:hypothetical protein
VSSATPKTSWEKRAVPDSVPDSHYRDKVLLVVYDNKIVGELANSMNFNSHVSNYV